MSAKAIIAEIDATIAKLKAVRAEVERAGDALNGLSVCRGVMFSPLLQLHCGPMVTDAKIPAKALAPTWTREIGGQWRAPLPSVPGVEIILHRAEPAERNPVIVQL